MKIKAYPVLVFIIISWVTIHAKDITGNIEGRIADASGTPLFGVRLFGKNLIVNIQGVYKVLRETIDDAYAFSLGRYIWGNPGKGILSYYSKPYRKYTALVFVQYQNKLKLVQQQPIES